MHGDLVVGGFISVTTNPPAPLPMHFIAFLITYWPPMRHDQPWNVTEIKWNLFNDKNHGLKIAS